MHLMPDESCVQRVGRRGATRPRRRACVPAASSWCRRLDKAAFLRRAARPRRAAADARAWRRRRRLRLLRSSRPAPRAHRGVGRRTLARLDFAADFAAPEDATDEPPPSTLYHYQREIARSAEHSPSGQGAARRRLRVRALAPRLRDDVAATDSASKSMAPHINTQVLRAPSATRGYRIPALARRSRKRRRASSSGRRAAAARRRTARRRGARRSGRRARRCVRCARHRARTRRRILSRSRQHARADAAEHHRPSAHRRAIAATTATAARGRLHRRERRRSDPPPPARVAALARGRRRRMGGASGPDAGQKERGVAPVARRAVNAGIPDAGTTVHCLPPVVVVRE